MNRLITFLPVTFLLGLSLLPCGLTAAAQQAASQQIPVQQPAGQQDVQRRAACYMANASRVPDLSPGRDGVIFYSLELETRWKVLRQLVPDFAHISARLSQLGTLLVVVPVPTKATVFPQLLRPDVPEQAAFLASDPQRQYADLVADLRAHAVQTVSLLPALQGRPDLPTRDPIYFGRDFHWTEAGAAIAAQTVGAALRKLVQFAPPATYRSDFDGREPFAPDTPFTRLKALCAVGGDDLFYDTYRTSAPGAAVTRASLFGDDAAPITLVGTSYSADYLNFAGFLRQATGQDVLNVAEVGGGYFGAMTAYLRGSSLKRHPPRVLVWEVPQMLGNPYNPADARAILDLLK